MFNTISRSPPLPWSMRQNQIMDVQRNSRPSHSRRNEYRMMIQVHSTTHPVRAAAFVHPSETTHEVGVGVALAAQSKLVVGGIVVHPQG